MAGWGGTGNFHKKFPFPPQFLLQPSARWTFSAVALSGASPCPRMGRNLYEGRRRSVGVFAASTGRVRATRWGCRARNYGAVIDVDVQPVADD